MNRVNNHLYSMTRSAGVKDPLQPVVYQPSHWSVVDGIPSLLPNKSPFHITRVVRTNSESEDDVIEEDKLALRDSDSDKMSSTEKDHDVSVTEHHLPLANILNKEINNSADGVQSRFRIVKIESKGLFKRGRWTCRDFADPPEAKASDVAATESIGSSSTTEPVFYVQGAGAACSQLIFYSEGHPVLESDACASKLFIATESGQTLLSMCRQSGDHASGDSGLKSVDVANSDAGSDGTVGNGLGDRRHDFDRVSWPTAHEEFGTTSLLSLVVDESNEPTTAGGSLSEIDNKIEQAMDLVKAHLMLAVRAEIEDLKEQIKQLMVKNHQLEYENKILREAADPDLLTTLDTASTDIEYNNGS